MKPMRMWQWIVLTVVLLAAIAWTAPQQLPVMLYKVAQVTLFAVLGYWIDRTVFYYSRPDKVMLAQQGWAWLRRAIVIGCVVLAGALGL